MQVTVSPPPMPPELPEAARPRWPWWYGPLAFLAGGITGFISAGIVWAVAGVDDPTDSAGAIVIGVTTTFPTLPDCDYLVPDLRSIRIVESTSSGLRVEVNGGA